jgi:hypothetical protein
VRSPPRTQPASSRRYCVLRSWQAFDCQAVIHPCLRHKRRHSRRCQVYPTHSYGTRCPSRGSRRTRPTATSRAGARDTFPAAIPAPSRSPTSSLRRPTWLDLAHRKRNKVVFAAYGWSADLSDEEILSRLLALNLQRASAQEMGSSEIG